MEADPDLQFLARAGAKTHREGAARTRKLGEHAVRCGSCSARAADLVQRVPAWLYAGPDFAVWRCTACGQRWAARLTGG